MRTNLDRIISESIRYVVNEVQQDDSKKYYIIGTAKRDYSIEEYVFKGNTFKALRLLNSLKKVLVKVIKQLEKGSTTVEDVNNVLSVIEETKKQAMMSRAQKNKTASNVLKGKQLMQKVKQGQNAQNANFRTQQQQSQQQAQQQTQQQQQAQQQTQQQQQAQQQTQQQTQQQVHHDDDPTRLSYADRYKTTTDLCKEYATDIEKINGVLYKLYSRVQRAIAIATKNESGSYQPPQLSGYLSAAKSGWQQGAQLFKRLQGGWSNRKSNNASFARTLKGISFTARQYFSMTKNVKTTLQGNIDCYVTQEENQELYAQVSSLHSTLDMVVTNVYEPLLQLYKYIEGNVKMK